MNTLFDTLSDFALEAAQIQTDGDDPDSYNEQLRDIIDDYVQRIKDELRLERYFT